MNSVIKEFWEHYYGAEAKGDETSSFYSIAGKEEGFIVIAMKAHAIRLLDSTGKHGANLKNFKDNDWVYPFRGRWNDEQTMLRLIKLKAFL